MRVDSHQHFWIYNEKEYGWIGEQMKILKKNYLPDDLIPELKLSGFDGTVAVQARQSLEETRWLLRISESNKYIKGVVGWVDLCSDDVHTRLSEFVRFPKFVGVRHVIHDETDDNFILRKDFLDGIMQLKEFSLSYDILILPRHLKNTIRFVEKFPDLTFILDHLGKPDIKGKKLTPWREHLRELSNFPNVFCKLSGMVTEADMNNWTEPDFKEFLDEALKSFGIDRLMIGSDWPVCKLGGSYPEVMNIVLNFFSGFTESEKSKVFGENAIRVYRLKSC